MHKLSIQTVAAAAVMIASFSANALTVIAGAACAATDISPAASSCFGFYQGNLIAGSPAVKADLQAAIGHATWLEKVQDLKGSTSVDFKQPLSGRTLIGVHYGAGSNAFANITDKKTNGTAFYWFEAGTMLDTVGLNFKASSNAAVFATSQPVPEPETYALMAFGLGAVGLMVRRRSSV